MKEKILILKYNIVFLCALFIPVFLGLLEEFLRTLVRWGEEKR